MKINKCKATYQRNEFSKNHMKILKEVEKSFDKIQHLIIIKTLKKLDTEGTYLKKNYRLSMNNPYLVSLNREKLKTFPQKIWNKTRIFTFNILLT